MSELRGGYTTGSCAAAAAKAAAILLTTNRAPGAVEIDLPDGGCVTFPVLFARWAHTSADAAVRKDAGDDPDITNGAIVIAQVTPIAGDDIIIMAGEGVGTVTRPGLSVPPGEPAVNPVPRRMIRQAVREVTAQGLQVTLSLPGGREMAAKTFNPRLGIEGGLSILGTSGRVRPFSCPALRTSLKCLFDVTVAGGARFPVFVPGRIGERAVSRIFPRVDQKQVVAVSNEWGFMLDAAAAAPLAGLLIAGHPGKLAKLAMGVWDTHSSRSPGAVSFVAAMMGALLDRQPPDVPTVEGLFAALTKEERKIPGNNLAEMIRQAVEGRLGGKFPAATVLVNMHGEWLGSSGDLKPWM
jgi:cobalt-precorrin-5B (C1)-methyltransferase